MRRIRTDRSTAALVVALVALVVASVGPANAVEPAKIAVSKVAKALKLAKKADKRSKKALRLAQQVRAKGEPGPAGPQGARGETGSQGPKGDPGAAGATNVIIRRGVLETINADANVTTTVACNPGEVATGGGIELRNGADINDMVAWGSVPTPGDTSADLKPNGWRVRARNEDANNDNLGSIQVRAEVVCSSP